MVQTKIKTVFTVLLLLFLNLSAFSDTPLTPDYALKYAKNKLTGDIEKMDFYYCEVNANINNIKNGNFNCFEVNSDTPNYYVFFVDEEPNKGWAHKCSYIFVPKILRGRVDMIANTVRLQYNMPQKTNAEFIPIDNKNRYPSNNSSLKIRIPQKTENNEWKGY